jgi:glycosyltransferase involved in cell wall biosynthesis
MNPLITIGIPTFNRSGLLIKTIEQILIQTYSKFELIIYNDGSQDNTSEIVNKFNDSRIKFIDKKENKGMPFPLNEILNHSSGDFFIYISDHDLIDKYLIEKCYSYFEKYPEISMVMPGLYNISDGQKKNQLLNWELFNDGNIKLVEYLNRKFDFSSPFHASCMYSMKKLEQVNRIYNIEDNFFADLDLTFRIILNNKFVYINEPLIGLAKREVNHVLNKNNIRNFRYVYNINYRFIHNSNLENYKIDYLNFHEKTKNILNYELAISTFKGINQFKETKNQLLFYFPDIFNKKNFSILYFDFLFYFFSSFKKIALKYVQNS